MTNNSQEDDEQSAPQNDSNLTPATVIDTRALFGDAREICLEHDGEKYRLRITRKGRLILSK